MAITWYAWYPVHALDLMWTWQAHLGCLALVEFGSHVLPLQLHVSLQFQQLGWTEVLL